MQLNQKMENDQHEQSSSHEPIEFSPQATELVNVANQDCDSLAKLAYNLYKLSKDDHIVIDRKRNEVIRTDSVTHQMTIYRCLDPIGMGMRPAEIKHTPLKVGRPPKRISTQTTSAAAVPLGKPSPLPQAAVPAEGTHRTRSGRLVRPSMPQAAPVPTGIASEPTSAQLLEALVADLRDKDYYAPMPAPKTSPVEVGVSQRSVPKNAICPGCNKIFLGRRMQRHFVKFPEHMPRASEPSQPPQQVQPTQATSQPLQPSLFGLLTTQLQRHSHLSEEQRADLFLHELNDFVVQLQLRSTRLIRNTSGLHFVNARIARVLGIPEGQYALDMSAMESAQAPTPEPEQLLPSGPAVGGGRNLVDYTGLSMSLDDTLTDEAAQRLNLSAGGKLLPPSEESLLRNVSDLMQPPVAGAPPTLGHGYDHASDNAVEALSMKETPNAADILDLKVDFFQFNPN
ncbi:uncharacterized protein LOC108164982 [Drosophila miranda]|uniref:uncharacterized protein LOC108164982 n=1 Tax=Drosophila miranda TaxID=7229 RepID=UPI0007E6DBA8|nr:uncharacterized protein LOC108164982 [Drosophila miranda]